ncbi:MAG: hypothetical protein ACPGSB_03645, partial [Opitutales bacterium]
IEKALAKADSLMEELADAPYATVPNRRQMTPVIHMKLVMWREAQVRTGRADPLWGLRIFQWLDRPDGLSWSAKSIGPLYGNIIGRMHEAGQLGEAHLLILKMENSLKDDGLNTLSGETSDLGPWSERIPGIRKRPFPVHTQTQGERPSRHFKFSYFLAMGNIAAQAYAEGEWQRAAELYIWIRKYADSYIEANPGALTGQDNQSYETLYSYQYSTTTLAEILELNGEFTDALEILEPMIARDYRPYDGSAHFNAQFYREYLLFKLGRSDSDALQRAARIYEAYSNNQYADISRKAQLTVFYSQLLEHHGEIEEAWKKLHDFESELDPVSLTPRNTIRIGKIKLAMSTGEIADVEKWLLESLDYVRSRGLKMRETELYELYAEYMADKQHYSDANYLLNEARRLYSSLGIESAVERTERRLADFRDMSSAQEGATAAVAPPLQIDLQPSNMTSETLKNQDAYGRFALSNLSFQSAEGFLKFEGHIETLTSEGLPYRLTLIIDDELPVRELQHELRLLANEQVIIDTLARKPKGDAGRLKLSYIQDDRSLIHAEWIYSSSPADIPKSFTNANFLQDNPYYLVPVFHTLQRRSIEVSPTTDFRFVAVVPMRIEVYDSSTGQLVYIDANGDGDWLDAGDQITQDLDRNGIPDVKFKGDSLTADIELHFHAPMSESGNPVEISLQMRVDDDWKMQCQNEISLVKQQ